MGEGYEDLVRKEIRRIRQVCGLSIQELANESGLSLSTVRNMEVGEASFSFINFARVCIALGEHPSEVMRRAEQEAIITY